MDSLACVFLSVNGGLGPEKECTMKIKSRGYKMGQQKHLNLIGPLFGILKTQKSI